MSQPLLKLLEFHKSVELKDDGKNLVDQSKGIKQFGWIDAAAVSLDSLYNVLCDNLRFLRGPGDWAVSSIFEEVRFGSDGINNLKILPFIQFPAISFGKSFKGCFGTAVQGVARHGKNSHST